MYSAPRFGMTIRTAVPRFVLLLALGIAMALGTSCNRPPASIDQLTYPPDFSYMPKERIRSSMWILAAEVGRLDELLRASPDSSSVALQNEIRGSLQRMAAAVEQIDHPGRSTQHPALNQHLRHFAERVAMAQRGADRTPPNYFHASALSGSCFLCHGSADDQER
jgi:hypothetical protein